MERKSTKYVYRVTKALPLQEIAETDDSVAGPRSGRPASRCEHDWMMTSPITVIAVKIVTEARNAVVFRSGRIFDRSISNQMSSSKNARIGVKG